MQLPQFNHIVPSEIQSTLEQLLDDNLKKLDQDPLSEPISLVEALDNRLQCFWSPVAHLHAVKSSPEWRKVYETCLPMLSNYETTLSHHEKLYLAVKNYMPRDAAEKRIVELKLRDFHLSGVDLPEAKKVRYKKIEEELSELQAKFGEHLLDATQSFEYQATDEELNGVPESLRPKDNKLTLDYPCYSSIQKYADNTPLREKLYHAYVTRASELSKHDNTEIMYKILLLRHELAQLLGFNHYASLSLATKMARKPEEVIEFLESLASTAKSFAEKDLETLESFAGRKLNPWDIAYYSEKLSLEKYHIDQEMFRPYFPLDAVLEGLFSLVSHLYHIEIKKVDGIEIWDDKVEVYNIYRDQKLIGIFYLDPFARKQKREGAWMDDYCSRWKDQIPVVYLTCNFLAQNPCLTHDDVITLFHEFGHGLHHLLTQVDRLDISGIAGVPWDAVETPSQFMENFCWEKSVLKNISNNKLPDDLIDKLISARYFQAGLQLVRQCEFALFDFYLHLEKPKDKNFVMDTYNKIHAAVAVIQTPDYVRFPHSFSHIFDGGYAAGYYSYLWAEVLSADIYSRFQEEGESIGKKFLETYLSQGGLNPPDILFKNFMGRAPDKTAFLRSWGLG